MSTRLRLRLRRARPRFVSTTRQSRSTFGFAGSSPAPCCAGDHPAAAAGAAGPAGSRLLALVLLVVAAGNDIGAGEPAVEVDVAAARRAERARGLARGLAADRTGSWDG